MEALQTLQFHIESILLPPLARLVLDFYDAKTSTLLTTSSGFYGFCGLSMSWHKLPVPFRDVDDWCSLACDESSSVIYVFTLDYERVQIHRFVVGNQWETIDYPRELFHQYADNREIQLYFLSGALYVHQQGDNKFVRCSSRAHESWDPEFETIPTAITHPAIRSVAFDDILIFYVFQEEQVELYGYSASRKVWLSDFPVLRTPQTHERVHLHSVPLEDEVMFIVQQYNSYAELLHCGASRSGIFHVAAMIYFVFITHLDTVQRLTLPPKPGNGMFLISTGLRTQKRLRLYP
jgi:hypothetical protein